MKKLLLVLFFGNYLGGLAKAQVALSYYANTSYLGICTKTTRKCWADLRIQTNTFLGFTNFEISPKLNLVRTEVIKTYVGVGINFNPARGIYEGEYLNGYLISAGVMVTPFPKARGLNLIFELSPYMNHAFTSGTVRTSLGIAWQFQKKRKENS